ncbi:MAG TPA: biosynthetic peptidoglycan transglycosylase, partial [bacterium]
MRKTSKLDRYWIVPAWILGGLAALFLGMVVGFQLYAPRVVRQFDAVIAQASNNTLVYDASDNPIAAVEGHQDRHAVPISRIHPFLQKAVVAIEDRRFFAHRGMDPVRLAGAVWADLKAMGYEQGASTITQQLVKLTLLSPERTLTRKVREIFMAMALEQSYPKLKLLEFYLNRVYLGNGVYGVEKA